MIGYVLLAGVILGVLLAGAHEEVRKRRRQEEKQRHNRKLRLEALEVIRLNGPEAYVSAAEADAFYRQEERLRLALGIGGPPAHPQCRCTLAPIDAYVEDLDRSIMRHTLDLGVPAEALDAMLTDVGRRLRRDLLDGLEPSELEVNRILKELERLSSSTE